MKKVLYILVFLMGGVVYVNAQNTTPASTPRPTPTPNPNAAIKEKIRENEKSSEKFEALKRDQTRSLSSSILRYYAADFLKPLYRKPTSKELELIAPEKEDLIKYRDFLQQKDTGLIKLVNNSECSENAKVVVATEECLRYAFPGAGSSYSFRVDSYRLPRLADITFADNSFQATGHFLHGIFVNIGNIPLENVNIQTNGLKFLTEFKPTSEYKSAVELDNILSKGVVHNGFVYRRALFAKENTTFALRSIAYRGKSYRAIKRATYNELDFDKRRDIIVAFRVVRQHEDGGVSLLWRVISNSKAPKLMRKEAR